MIRSRFAPSPTGSLHIGNLRTAIYAYALAKHSDGDFILRIEDTDKKREVAGGIDEIKDLLKIFGLNWDEFYVQSELAKDKRYLKAAKKLVEEGYAFFCDCKPKNAKEEGYSKELRDPCRNKNLTSGAIKLKTPDNEKIFFRDFVLNKDVEWDTSTVADATLLKSDGFPTYHLAVVVDDSQMKISHVLRGHGWLPSTPIHLLVYKYLSLKMPQIGHLTDILSPDGGKVSKRKGSVSVRNMLAEGYLPEALLNFVILLGWAPKDNQEILSLAEFVKIFDPKGFQKSNPILNREKLDWFNGHYIREKAIDDLVVSIKKFSKHKLTDIQAKRILGLVRDRMVTLSDFDELSNFFFEDPKIKADLFEDREKAKMHLTEAAKTISDLECRVETFNNDLQNLVKEMGWNMGEFFMSLRIAVCGSRTTPPITDTMVILGKAESIKRIKKAIDLL